MVCEGETKVEPESGTEPTPLLMENESAFAVVHESVDPLPCCTDVGETEREQVGAGGGAGGGGGGEVTESVVEQLAVPPVPEAVPV